MLKRVQHFFLANNSTLIWRKVTINKLYFCGRHSRECGNLKAIELRFSIKLRMTISKGILST